MKTFRFAFLVPFIFVFSSCMKHAFDYEPPYGAAINTWTFSDGTYTYHGEFAVDATLDTTIQSNNTYTLDMTGIQTSSGKILTMVISLADLDFTVKSYQCGISPSDHSTSFYFSGSAASSNAIYSSSNNNPGAVMTYNIYYYDPAKNTITTTFSGQAFDTNGHLVTISKGKMTALINRK